MKLIVLHLAALQLLLNLGCKPQKLTPQPEPKSSVAVSEKTAQSAAPQLLLTKDDLQSMTADLNVSVTVANPEDVKAILMKAGIWDRLSISKRTLKNPTLYIFTNSGEANAQLGLSADSPPPPSSPSRRRLTTAAPAAAPAEADASSHGQAVLPYVRPEGVRGGRLPRQNLPGLTDSESAAWSGGKALDRDQFRRFLSAVETLSPKERENFEQRLLVRYDGCRQCQLKAAKAIQGIRNLTTVGAVVGDAATTGAIIGVSAAVPPVGAAIGAAEVGGNATAAVINTAKGKYKEAVFATWSAIDGGVAEEGVSALLEATAHTTAAVRLAKDQEEAALEGLKGHAMLDPLTAAEAVKGFRQAGSVAYVLGFDADDAGEAYKYAIDTAKCRECGQLVKQGLLDRIAAHLQVTKTAAHEHPAAAFEAVVTGTKEGACRSVGRCTGFSAVREALAR